MAEYILLAIGIAAGFWTGRRWGEIGRAKHDMRKTWERRADYRDKG